MSKGRKEKRREEKRTIRRKNEEESKEKKETRSKGRITRAIKGEMLTNSTIEIDPFLLFAHLPYFNSFHWMRLTTCPRPPGERAMLSTRMLCNPCIMRVCVSVLRRIHLLYTSRFKGEREPFSFFCFFFTSFCLTMPWRAYLHTHMYHIHSPPFTCPSSNGHSMTTIIACLLPHGS